LTVPEFLESLPELVLGAIVHEDKVGFATLFVDRPLGSFPLCELVIGPTPSFGPLEPYVARGVDEQHEVAQGLPTGLEQKRGIEDHDISALGDVLITLCLQASSDSRVQQTVQKSTFGIGRLTRRKHATGHGSSVDRAIGRKHVVAPPLTQGVADLGVIC
jgi:hypothetical protein